MVNENTSHSSSFIPTKQVDIVIVGGGVIGLAMANSLSVLSASVLLVDAGVPGELELESVDPRVLAVSKKSEDLFRKLGVWDAVINARICPYKEMYVWDGEGTADIAFDADARGENSLGAIVENKVLVHALRKNLSGVEQIYNAEVENFECVGERSYIQLSNGDCVEASLVIAADGAHSRLRDLAELETKDWDYGHTAIVTTVKTEKSHANTAWQVFRSDGPLAFLPLSVEKDDRSYCSIVWSLKHETAEKMLAMDDEVFAKSLEKYFESKLGKILAVEARLSFPLKQRHATRYFAPGVVLVGDAAHTIHPLAGQGANIGFYDVAVLAEELIRAEKRELSFFDLSVAQRYQRRRQTENLVAMASMEGFKRLFGSDDLAVRWLRNEGLRMVNRIPFIKNAFSAVASGR